MFVELLPLKLHRWVWLVPKSSLTKEEQGPESKSSSRGKHTLSHFFTRKSAVVDKGEMVVCTLSDAASIVGEWST
jgi:hypothetical protein